ncbi:MAG TPA: type ISP restriction/modification enzyme [Casimicrobiaceae bacterium]|jgi:hypothetical protein|nr:type ISP restriction/modification enzyme [Casimicrobiaceae bacterium]
MNRNISAVVGSALAFAISTFGAKAKQKLANPAAVGSPEDQLRAPFEQLVSELAAALALPKEAVVAVGESSVSDLKTRPDYAVTVHKALVGFIELKAPGKGADPRKFKDPHDKAQWEKLHSLPNLLYSDGNAFSLWQDGQLIGSVVKLIGDIETSGNKLQAPTELLALFERFFLWKPIPPKSVKDLALMSARLCRLLREEVTEQLALKSEALTSLAVDWRRLLFPDATDERFADGYAQAVTFGLLMARAKKIELATGFDKVADELAHTSTLIGKALWLLTNNAGNQATLKTSLGTLTRVLDAVDWAKISKGNPEAWLYFYEDFLEVYDNKLRKQTGSYYTPPDVVEAMVRLVNEELIGPRFGLHAGIASPSVTLADPAVGTGTFLLGVLRTIASTIKADEGEGAVKAAMNAAIQRLIAFEMQLGPFAVAQLRILAEIVELTGSAPKTEPRMFVTNTLGNPDDEEGWIPGFLAPIAESRKAANRIKREEPITVVIGNPPYKEKAKGMGGWVEGANNKKTDKPSLLMDWIPPAAWGVGAHAKHLRNLYVYFWRWATWKVFDRHPDHNTGIVCFITVAGFLNGPGFQKMRDYLRRTCDGIWVIDCSPEGHQPEVNTRIFEGVQQPICITIASRSAKHDSNTPAQVQFRSLPLGHRNDKLVALSKLALGDSDWTFCPADWRAPFLPASQGPWASYPPLEDFFVYNGSGVQPKRTWVIAPDAQSLTRRWERLIATPLSQKEALFHATLRNGEPADRHVRSVVKEALPGYAPTPKPLIDENGPCEAPIRYGFRSFNRQWIIPDIRVITQPNAELWKSRSDRQVYLTALSRSSPTNGPAVTVTGLVPDLDYYKGSFGGRVFPLWMDNASTVSNIRPKLIVALASRLALKVTPEDVFAYIVAVAGHPTFIDRFHSDLSTPGLRIPLTANPKRFQEAVEVGRKVIWLQTFGERMADPENGRLAQPPRLQGDQAPRIPATGAIPGDTAGMPDSITYEAKSKRLSLGAGYVDKVEPAVWNYEVSGKRVLMQWFSYRKSNRERPIIGDRRVPSPLGDIQPDHWLPEYTTELINVLNVLALLVDLEPTQAQLLDKICAGPLMSAKELRDAGAFELPPRDKRKKNEKQVHLL